MIGTGQPDRLRHHLPHQLDGGPAQDARMDRTAPARPDPQPRQPRGALPQPARGTTARCTACRGRPGSPASPTTRPLTGRELRSIMDLFDPEFNGRVGLFTEMRDTLGLVMLGLGHDPAVVDEDGMQEALDFIEEATSSGQIRAFTGNEYLRSLESGDFVASVAWSGDIVQLKYARPGHRVRHPRGRRDELVRHDGHPQGRAQRLRGRRLDELRLRPRPGGPDSTYYVQYVSPGQGRARRAGQHGRRRGRPRRQPDPVPHRGGQRPAALVRRDARRARRQQSPTASSGSPEADRWPPPTADNRRCASGRRIPYVIAAPGLLFLFIFFIVPLITLFKISLSTQARSAAAEVRLHVGVEQLPHRVRRLRVSSSCGRSRTPGPRPCCAS